MYSTTSMANPMPRVPYQHPSLHTLTYNIYNVSLHNDMGHLMCHNHANLPPQVIEFVYKMVANKIDVIFIDGCRRYKLKPEFQPSWTYKLPTCTITIDYSHLDSR